MPNEYHFQTDKLQRPCGSAGTTPVIIALCGSFNPVHRTHLALYSAAKKRVLACAETNNSAVASKKRPQYQVLGGYLSPVSDAYGKPGLLNFHHRVAILEAALASHAELSVDCWEGLQPAYTRTFHVLSHLEEVAQAWQRAQASEEATPAGNLVRVIFACGADLFDSFFKPGCWPLTLLQQLLDRFQIVVVGRPGYGNDRAELAQKAKDPSVCVLREYGPDGAVTAVLDLSQYEFLFTVFDHEDDTSATMIRQLAVSASATCTTESAALEARLAAQELAKVVPEGAVDLVIKYYGRQEF